VNAAGRERDEMVERRGERVRVTQVLAHSAPADMAAPTVALGDAA
jgi:hypothetical protein